MILRAIFWIGLVSLLMPHEPDLGFGRPGSGLAALLPSAAAPSAPAPTSIAALIEAPPQTSAPAGAAAMVPDVAAACAAHATACAGGLSILDGFQRFAVRSMDQVRADLEANRTKMH